MIGIRIGKHGYFCVRPSSIGLKDEECVLTMEFVRDEGPVCKDNNIVLVEKSEEFQRLLACARELAHGDVKGFA